MSVTFPKPRGVLIPITCVWDHILHLLRLIIIGARNTLVKVTISVHAKPLPHFPSVRDLVLNRIPQGIWDRFEDTLALLDVDQLTRVALRMGRLDSPTMSMMSNRFRQSLRKFRERGILRVSACDTETP